jgi:hypothetical protein
MKQRMVPGPWGKLPFVVPKREEDLPPFDLNVTYARLFSN